MGKYLLGFAAFSAFVSTQGFAGTSSYSVEGRALHIERIGFYLDPALSEALAEAVKAAAKETNKNLGREAVSIEAAKMEAGLPVEQNLVSTISLAPTARFAEASETLVGNAYWSDDSINEVDIEINSDVKAQEPEAARAALGKFLRGLIKE